MSDYITNDTSIAAVVNLDEVFRKAGMPIGSQSASEETEDDILSLATLPFNTKSLVPLISQGAIDTKEVLLVKLADRTELIGVKVTDEDAFDKEVGKEDYPAVTIRRGSLCFLSENRRMLDKFLSEAEGESHAPLKVVSEKLADDDGTINMVCHSPADIAGDHAEWVTSSIKVGHDAISAEVGALDKQGSAVPFGEMFGEIDTSALNLTPSDAVLAVAFGHPTSDMTGIDKLLKEYTGLTTGDISGTSTLSLAMAGSVDNLRSAGPEAYNLQFVTAADGEEAARMTSLCSRLHPSSSIIDGQHVAEVYGCDLYFTAIDGYFAQSLNRPVAIYTNDLAPRFEEKRFALSLNIPSGSSLMSGLGLPTGVSLDIAMTSDLIKARLRFNGSTKPAMLTLSEFDRDMVEWLGATPALIL